MIGAPGPDVDPVGGTGGAKIEAATLLPPRTFKHPVVPLDLAFVRKGCKMKTFHFSSFLEQCLHPIS